MRHDHQVSSIEGVPGYPVDPVYGSFKAAVVQFTVDGHRRGQGGQYPPFGRMGLPIDQARVISLLASELSGFLVGQTIHTDGGTEEASGWFRSTRRAGRTWTNRPFEP